MNNLQILIVDDDKISNNDNVRTIKESGLTNCVKTALNGGHALLLLSQTFTDLRGSNLVIFLDINMPIMDGISFLKEFERLEYDYKENVKIVILTTGDTTDYELNIAKQMGVTEFVDKRLCKKGLSKIVMSSTKLEKVA